MKISFPTFFCLVVSCLAAANTPPGFKPAAAGTRHEVSGYSVEVPGKGWLEGRNGNAVVFGKRIDATESYHAGLNVTPAAAFASRADFVEQVRAKLLSEGRNPRFTIVRNDLADSERDGLWILAGRLDFDDSGAVNVGKHDALATRNAHLYAVDPKHPDRVIGVWFSWRGTNFDEARFQAEADRYFASFRASP